MTKATKYLKCWNYKEKLRQPHHIRRFLSKSLRGEKNDDKWLKNDREGEKSKWHRW